MKPRIEYAKAAPGTVQAMRALETYVQQSGLERSLLHLIKTRASQINGCAFCLDMHTREAREDGETEERLYVLSAWRETADYTERERAALAWTEAVTRIADGRARRCLRSRAPAVHRTRSWRTRLAVVAINGWNRLSIAFRTLPAKSREPRRDGHQ